jgi:Tfp pilus assembly protein PilF/YHS domain-containing protein
MTGTFCVSTGRWLVCLAVCAAGCATASRVPATVVTAPAAAAPTTTVSPTSTPPVALISLAAAERLEAAGQLHEARKAYADVVQQQPRHAEGLHRLAVVCTKLNDHAAAAEHYNQALELDGNNVELLTDAGYACYLRGEFAAAEVLLHAAAQRSPDHERAVNNLGLVQGMTGRPVEALQTFWRVNSPVDAWRNMAFVYQQRGDWQQAVACHREAQKLDPRVTIPQALLAKVAEPPAVQVAAARPEPSPSREPLRQEPTPEFISPIHATDITEHFEAPVFGEEPGFIEEPEFSPEPDRDIWALLQEDQFGPFEPPTIRGLSSAAESFQQTDPDDVRTVRKSTLPIIAPAWSTERVTVLPEAPERPWKRGTSPDEFEPVFFEADEKHAPATASIVLAEHAPAVAHVTDDGSVAMAIEPNGRATAESHNEPTLARCCLVTLFTERRFVPSVPDHSVEYEGVRFYFSTADAADRFAADPSRYLPAAAGLDVVAIRRQGATVPGELRHATWFRGRLYLFALDEHLAAFQTHPYRYIDYE